MKKLFLALCFCLVASWGVAQEEGIMIINPGRETFVHFPSSVLGNKYTLTVFLPEDAVPLSKRYPVVYLLGAGPKEAQQAQQFLLNNKALVVGINFEEADYQNRAKIVEFISRELVPYIDTNYLTFTDDSARFIAAKGKSAALTALELFAKPNLFGGVALASSADAVETMVLPAGNVRVFVTGNQTELAVAQKKLEWLGLTYGEDFAMLYAPSYAGLFDGLDFAYLYAADADVSLRSLKASANKTVLPLQGEDAALLTVTARLNNGRRYAYVPVSLRMSPPYLDWNPLRGELTALSGAEPGKVQIRGGVDKTDFKLKIKLKKQ